MRSRVLGSNLFLVFVMLLAAAIFLFPAATSQAVNQLQWDVVPTVSPGNLPNGNWDAGTLNNWCNVTPPDIPWFPGDDALFGAFGPVNGAYMTTNPNGTGIVTVTPGVLVQNMTFDLNYTLNPSGAAVISLTGTPASTITVTNLSNTATINTILGGFGIGLTKEGLGTLALSAANTYTGGTTVHAGTLKLTSGDSINPLGGSINPLSPININGATARLVQNSSVTITQPVTVTNVTLDGTTTVNNVVVRDATEGTMGIISNGNGTGSTLTINTLTFNGVGTMNLFPSILPLAPAAVQTTDLFTSGVANSITLNTTANYYNPGVYNLVGTSSAISIENYNAFRLGTIKGLNAPRQVLTKTPWVVGTTVVSVTVASDNPVWTGAGGVNDWNTNVANMNWILPNTGAPPGTITHFIAGDVVKFDDTATDGFSPVTVNISTASVSPTATVFENSFRDYTVTSPGLAFGIVGNNGKLIVNGSGTVTINTNNNYHGGTTVSGGGTLILNGNSAFGSGDITVTNGTLTLAGHNSGTGTIRIGDNTTFNINNNYSIASLTLTILGITYDPIVIDNTSDGPVTLVTNNAQTWGGDFTFNGTNDLNLGTGNVTLTGDVTITANGAATLTVGGNISGAFALSKSGPGTVIFSGANTYSGTTTINAGVYELTSTSQINPESAFLTTDSSAVFLVDGGSHTVGTISGTGNTIVMGDGDLSATSITQGTLTIGSPPYSGEGEPAPQGSMSQVPEPATWVMLMLAAMGLVIYRRRNR